MNELIPLQTVIQHTYSTLAGGRSVAYTVLVSSRLNAPVSYRTVIPLQTQR